MKCHKLLYKPYRKTPPYQDFILRQRQKQQKKKKQLFYQQIISFRQSRYPLEFLKQLEQKINPFQLSLQKLKEVFSKKHPQYSNQLVNESVQHIFNRKCQESQMVKESAIIIEDGDQYIRNGRKLIKEDFSYEFSNLLLADDKINGDQSSRSNSKSNNPQNFMKTFAKIINKDQPQENNQIQNIKGIQNPPSTDRNAMTTDRQLSNRSRTDSPSKIIDIMKKTQRFNELLLQQIRKDKQRFQNLDQVEEGSSRDMINYNYQQQHNAYTDRSRQNESLNSFRQSDLIVRPDTLDTGRSQVQQLNFLLSSLNFEQGNQGQQTRRSGRSQKQLRINRQIKQQLFNARGTLKLDLVRRAVQLLRKENKMSSPRQSGDISRINRS